MTLDEGHCYIYFLLHNLWKSKFMAPGKPGKLGIFFSYFVATLYNCDGDDDISGGAVMMAQLFLVFIRFI